MRLVAVVVAACVCPACTSTSRAQVVVYTSVDQVYSEPLLARFTRETGVVVLPVYDVEATKTTGLVNRLLAERERPRADVFWNGEFVQTLLLQRRGVLAPCAVAASSELPAGYVDPDHFWTSVGGRVRVLLTSREVVGPTGLRSLLDAAIPANRVGIAHPLFGTSATHAAALYALWGAEEARRFYATLRQRGTRVVDGNSVVRDLVSAGQLAVGLTDSDDACGALARGADVRMWLPDQDGDGTLLIPGTVAVIRGAPHPAEARRLAEFLTSAETERLLIESGFAQLSLRPAGAVSPCLAARPRTLAVSPRDVYENLAPSRQDLTAMFLR